MRRQRRHHIFLLTVVALLAPHQPRAAGQVPLRPQTIAQVARHYYEDRAEPFVSNFGSWRSRTLAFPLPKADDAPALTDPFGDGTQIVLHLENYDARDWCYPVPGAYVTSPFGERGERGHSGTDIKTFGEDRICAAFDGVVTMSEPFSGYGNCIVISHNNGFSTLYSHNLRNMVNVGEHVSAGQVISLIGSTGHATGDHLHFECRFEDHAFDSSLIFDHENNKLHRHKVLLTKGGTVRVVP